MKNKLTAILLAISILFPLIPHPVRAETANYSDVPQGHWSQSFIDSAKAYDLMQGVDDGVFGFGNTITKAEFITVLSKMFKWQAVNPETASFSDVASEDWFYPYIETALEKGVIEKTQVFDPTRPITREEMAVMLVKGLGYSELAKSAVSFGSPFTDVNSNAGYIAIASDIGMTKGTGENTFSPKLTAKREEAAAMVVQVYDRYVLETEWTHGFYAFSSFSQRELTRNMDAVSLGWSRMSYDPDRGIYLNTTSSGSNEWAIPSSYEDIISYFKGNSTKTHLSVYMDASEQIPAADGSSIDILNYILLDSERRTQAVDAIINELTVQYAAIGSNPYSGVTIDFEQMRGEALKSGFNAFLSELSAALKPLGKTLYVAVSPATPDGVYFDGYDYRTIGNIADKVILMAHDYNALSMPDSLIGSEYYRNTPVTPFDKIYYALKAITDENTGVEDKSKIALAISFSSIGWELKDSKIVGTKAVRPAPATIHTRLKSGAERGYSEIYRNPYIRYTAEDGKEYFVWYEDERSVEDKIDLAKLFGINGVSLWRVGTIPNYPEEGLNYDIMKSIE